MVTPTSSSPSIQTTVESQNSGTGSQPAGGRPAHSQPNQALPAPAAGAGHQIQGQPVSGAPSSTPHHPIAEFLYQLTKMLTDDNREIIEWSNGKIKVHHPERLESEVLHKYFRHSKFASFQRQLNYFGFRKIAGKGKMSPCSYVNDAATSDIRSLLLIKRKTNGSAARKAAMAQRGMAAAAAAAAGVPPGFLTPALGGAAGVAALGMGTDFLNKALSGQAQALGAVGLHQTLLIPEMQQQAAALQQQAFQSAAKHKAIGESLFFPSDNALAALAQGQKRQSLGELAGLAMKASSIDQLNGQIGALAAQRNSALNLAALGMAAAPAAAAASAALAAAMPATAAANMAAGTMPATAAANATAAVAGQANNLFESSNNLSALVGNDQSNNKAPGPAPANAPAPAQAPGSGGVPSRLSSQNLLTRLPSSSAIFPDSLSSVSLTGLLPGMSSNRLSSMLSLSSFLSRDPSAAELVPGSASAAQLGAAAATPFAAFPFGGVPLAPLTASPFGIPAQAPIPAPQAANPAPATSAPPGPAAPAAPPTGFEPTPIQDM
eukprot:CAMPEP_0116547942 /NCGR_PEP_ID=MMETSP0397-20121206/4053_1 /TAXON_ID=216820 /ORGANISM="Cyclophora tenuis, Strain ECT3854" /LENGTH=548 /DNA_ID=CAMNT_0004072521 /DNA_START=244 /DNA_END=1890 /DNA_ORIENTATION=+